MATVLPLAVVALAALYLCGLGVVSLVAPSRASIFLLGFAQTPRVHYFELLMRLVVGWALVEHSPRMALSSAFGFFGWVLFLTTVLLFLLPWRWHRRFAERAVPLFTRYIAIIGGVSILLGGLIFVAVIRGSAA
jgi:hypothetical protein